MEAACGSLGDFQMANKSSNNVVLSAQALRWMLYHPLA
jgi:hypothetical protein